MTEKHFIESFDRMHPNLIETIGECTYNLIKNWLHGAYSMGYTEAINHPVNPWHKTSEELPKEGQHILSAHKMRTGDYMTEAIWYPEPGITNNMEYWMEIPEIKEN